MVEERIKQSYINITATTYKTSVRHSKLAIILATEWTKELPMKSITKLQINCNLIMVSIG